jgi:hypothetical protein
MLHVLGTILYYIFVVGLIAVLLAVAKHTVSIAWSGLKDGGEDWITRVVMLLVPVVALWMAVTLAVYAIGTAFGAEWRILSP